jgi:hypothetical protein
MLCLDIVTVSVTVCSATTNQPGKCKTEAANKHSIATVFFTHILQRLYRHDQSPNKCHCAEAMVERN